MPSPPASVSSCHQVVARCSLARSVVSTARFAVEQHPVGGELVEQPGRVRRGADALEESAFELCIVEEAATGARVADAEALVDDAEAPPGNVVLAADDHDRARTHVLLLADDA